MIEQVIQANTEALNALTAAILAANGKTTGSATGSATSSKTTSAADTGAEDKKAPFLWANNDVGTFGEEKTFAALTKKLKEDKKAARISQDLYDQLVAAAAEEGEEEEEEEEDDKAKAPTLDDIKKTFGGFLKIDDEKKRDNRKKWAATLLEQFGVERATELKPEHRAEAIDYIERVLGGEKLDPKTANKAGGADEEEDDQI